jgi:DNA-binding beta-propeller fold protein YncE
MGRATFAILLVTAGAPTLHAAVEPRVFVVGVWPNRIRFFDEVTEEFVGEVRLRYGAVTNVFGSDRTPDFRRFFFITDRMEAVEVLDVASRSLVDEVKISSPDRRVRMWGAAPDAAGRVLFLTVEAIGVEVDRFVTEDVDVIQYDLETRQVVRSFPLPAEIRAAQDELFALGPGGPPLVRVAPDGKSLYVIVGDIFQVDVESQQVLDRIVLSKPRSPGYGAAGLGQGPVEAAPGILYGFYRSPDPVLKKTMFGIARVDLNRREVETFDVSQDVNVEWLGLSPDGKRAYAGMRDLVAVDLETRMIVALRERVEQGRQNTTIVVSADGKKLYVAGVGPNLQVYDATTLEPIRAISAGGDIMNPPQPVPKSVFGR